MLSLVLSFTSTTFEPIKKHRNTLYEDLEDFEDKLELVPELANGERMQAVAVRNLQTAITDMKVMAISSFQGLL